MCVMKVPTICHINVFYFWRCCLGVSSASSPPRHSLMYRLFYNPPLVPDTPFFFYCHAHLSDPHPSPAPLSSIVPPTIYRPPILHRTPYYLSYPQSPIFPLFSLVLTTKNIIHFLSPTHSPLSCLISNSHILFLLLTSHTPPYYPTPSSHSLHSYIYHLHIHLH